MSLNVINDLYSNSLRLYRDGKEVGVIRKENPHVIILHPSQYKVETIETILSEDIVVRKEENDD